MKEPSVRPPPAKASQPWWREGWLFCLCLAAATALAYQPAWHGDFLWDDNAYLTDNPAVHQASGWWRVWTQKTARDFVPAVEDSFWLEWRCWGNNPLGCHLDNLLLHILAALLIWRILARLKIPGARLAAAVFALHPVNVESVAWIAERKNTLSMFLYLGAMLSYLRFEDSKKRRWYWAGLVLFILALASKTAIAPLPVALLGLAWWRRGRVESRDLFRSAPFFAAAVGGGLLGTWIQRGMGGGIDAATLGSRVAGAGRAFWFYLGKIVLPIHLAPVYARWHIDSSRWVSYLPAAAIPIAFGVAWIYRKQWGRAVVAALGYFLALLAPALGLVAIGSMFWVVADHWQYFAIIGPIALAAACLTRFLPKPGIWAAGALMLAALSALTWKHCRAFQNPVALWQATLAEDPNSFAARGAMGAILFRNGQTGEAITELKTAIALEPAYANSHYDLGNIYLQAGQVSAAAAEYQNVLQYSPHHVLAMNNLAWILAACPDASLRDGRRAVELALAARSLAENEDSSTAGTLAAAYAEAGSFPQAVAAAREALALAQAAQNGAKIAGLEGQLQCYERGAPFRDQRLGRTQ
ncbi:MAG TPA: tetratricopeptide repeat protein [Verrucomicrobiae bacterium]